MASENPTCSVRLYVGSNLPDQPGKRISDREMRSTLVELTSLHFRGATFTQARGLWDGELEESYTVEVFPAEDLDCNALFRRGTLLGRELAKRLRQTAVMVVSTDSAGNMRQGFASGA